MTVGELTASGAVHSEKPEFSDALAAMGGYVGMTPEHVVHPFAQMASAPAASAAIPCQYFLESRIHAFEMMLIQDI